MADRRTITLTVEVEDAPEDHPFGGQRGSLEVRAAKWIEEAMGNSDERGVITHGYQLAFGDPVPAPNHRADVERGLRGGTRPDPGKPERLGLGGKRPGQ